MLLGDNAMLFDYYILSTVKQGASHYLVTIIDNRSIFHCFGNISSEYMIKANNKGEAEKIAMGKHENLTKK
jgi:hypothetical protein